MSFDRKEHATGLSHKIKFYIVYGNKFFFLLIHVLVVKNYELPKNI